MAMYYCKWCGSKTSSPSILTVGNCPSNPEGKKHEIYEGNEKSMYVCKYCGNKSSSFSGLCAGNCPNSPSGKHSPL
jgi:DNA-directed RNA polymerase subunit RPC12/RpoP